MDQCAFVFATRGQCIKGKQCQLITIKNQIFVFFNPTKNGWISKELLHLVVYMATTTSVTKSNICLCSKQYCLFSFYALPSGGKAKAALVHWINNDLKIRIGTYVQINIFIWWIGGIQRGRGQCRPTNLGRHVPHHLPESDLHGKTHIGTYLCNFIINNYAKGFEMV